jgi:ProP effector
VTEAELGRALRIYCCNHVYRSRLITGATRIDLNGEPAGIVTPEQQADLRAAAKPSPPSSPPAPKRIGLADLKAAAERRRQAGEP